MKIKTLVIIGLVSLNVAGCNPSGSNADKKSARDTIAGKPDPNKLVGEWIRSDGDYRLKILSATADGKLDAGYFNPDPIHVERAEWLIKDKNIIINVVLRDINYPGSTYTLQYFPREDRLAGNYYQAVERANYGVEFVRQK